MLRQEAQAELESLGIREEAINAELQANPALSYDAASRAVDAKKALREFEEGAYAVYLAHVHRYAHLYLKMTDEKDTISAVNDAVITLFSRESAAKFNEYAIAICDYQLDQQLGKAEAGLLRAKDKDGKRQPKYIEAVKAMYKDMYKYVLAPNDFPYEYWIGRRIALETEYDRAAALAERFKERAHCLVAIAANLRSAGDVDAYRTNPYSVEIIERMKRAIAKNPDVNAQVLSEIAGAQWKAKKEE